MELKQEKRWRCTICGYVHIGPAPPEKCPLCGAGPEAFELLPADPGARRPKPLHTLSYGLYIVASERGTEINGQCANTVFQITSEPAQIAIGIGTDRYTHQFISESGLFSIGVLAEDGIELAKHFGFKSGRDLDKFADVEYRLSDLGLPLLTRALAIFQCRVQGRLECGTHTLFLGEVLSSEVQRDGKPLTYAEYLRRK